MRPDPCQPIYFMPNRVWRCYTGGYLLERFVCAPAPADGHFPEDWVGSTVVAQNGEHAQGPEEGLARVRDANGEPGGLFRDLLSLDPAAYLGRDPSVGELSILCKYLDSAVRLPIQCHPDVPFAKEHYGSDHGKTEAWVILDTRTVGGVEPYLLMGFRPGVSADTFAQAVERQDVPAMERMLHRVPARAGDVWLIPGRFPHAIGSGVFLMEVQEPSDWVVQPEARCADTALSPRDMWGPLDPEVGLRCFDYHGQTLDEVRAASLCLPEVVLQQPGGRLERLIGPERTPCFGVDRTVVHGTFTLPSPSAYRIEVVASGCGTLLANGVATPVRQGQAYFVPYGVREVAYTSSDSPLTVLAFKPGG